MNTILSILSPFLGFVIGITILIVIGTILYRLFLSFSSYKEGMEPSNIEHRFVSISTHPYKNIKKVHMLAVNTAQHGKSHFVYQPIRDTDARGYDIPSVTGIF